MMRTSGSFAGKRVDRENECCYNNKAIYEPLAQSVEHLTFNQGVRGSNPRWLTKKSTPRNKYVARRFLYLPDVVERERSRFIYAKAAVQHQGTDTFA